MPRMKDKLVARTVESVRYEGRDRKLFDGGGLFLHVQKAGKHWRLKYRLNGKEKLLSLGVYPEVGLKQARDEREKKRALLDKGIDPRAERRATRATSADAAADTLEAAAREW